MNQPLPKVVTIVGAGGLGTPAAWELCSTASPVPLLIRIIDHDIVERSNLNRQIMFGEQSLGQNKASTLAKTLERLTEKKTRFESIEEKLTADNCDQLLAHSSIILDATDSVECKFLLNDYCVKNSVPYCYGGVVGSAGQLLLSNPNSTNACLRCLFGDFSEQDYQDQAATCQQAGIIGAVAGTVGFLMAKKSLEFLNGELELSEGALLVRHSLAQSEQVETFVEADASCPLGCAERTNVKLLDLTKEKCPMTFLYTKLALEKIKDQSPLEVRFSSIESASNVERSVADEGYQILRAHQSIGPQLWSLKISSERAE